MYVIQRTDQGGGFLAPSGSHNAYTHNLQVAQTFTTKEKAEANCCPGNEVVVPLEAVMPKAI